MSKLVVVAALAVAAPACGAEDDSPMSERCALDNSQYYLVSGCQSGLRLALRYSHEILLQQSEWDEYYRIMAAVYRAAPLTQLAGPSGVGVNSELWFTTSYPPIVDAWSQGIVETGDPVVDSIFAPYATAVTTGPIITGAQHRVWAQFPTLVSIDEIGRRLEAVPDTDQPYLYRPLNDTRVTWAGDVAQLIMTGGWGDCFSGCAYYHSWTATVTRDDVVQVWDIGGDPIPDWLLAEFGLK